MALSRRLDQTKILEREWRELSNEANTTRKIREIRSFAAFAFKEIWISKKAILSLRRVLHIHYAFDYNSS